MAKREIEFDYSALDGKIVEICKTHGFFAERMGLSFRSESLKMNNKCEWKQSEMLRACDILQLRYETIPHDFFTVKVQ